MIERGRGSIITMASTAARMPTPAPGDIRRAKARIVTGLWVATRRGWEMQRASGYGAVVGGSSAMAVAAGLGAAPHCVRKVAP